MNFFPSHFIPRHLLHLSPLIKAKTSLSRKNLQKVGMSIQLIDHPALVANLTDSLVNLPVSPPSLYIDLEGIELGRRGTISIMTLYVLPTATTYLIDVYWLGAAAFTTEGQAGQSFKAILESDAIPKVMFDLRNDSDALFGIYQVNLGGIIDLQLLELATRGGSRKYVSGLAKCISQDAGLEPRQQSTWKACKEIGRSLFAPEMGGRYEVFNERPLKGAIFDYCAQDVTALPLLWSVYDAKLTPAWRTLVEKTTRERIVESQSQWYDANGPDKALGPWDDSGDSDSDEVYGSDIIFNFRVQSN